MIGDFLNWLIANWLLVLPVALGFVAIWFFLPQPQRRSAVVAWGSGAAALVIGGLVLVRSTGTETPWLFDLLFWVFAGLAIIAGACMIVQTNPVQAALWFAIVVLSTCGLFLLRDAPFLAAATIIVYAGAIIVTFLFVIMLAQQSGLAEYDRRSREPLLATIAGFILLGAVLYVLHTSFSPRDVLKSVVRKLHEAETAVAQGRKGEALEKDLYIGTKPLAAVLQEEARRVPAWRERNDVMAALSNTLSDLAAAKDGSNPEPVQKALRELISQAEQIRAAAGKHAGILTDATSTTKDASLSGMKESDAGYVAGLGRSLFGDYLWAVELAGMLLLVATIGAIAIAQRRKEAAR
jgi:NADH:ubiquinone oxidoreductase subunit 6 (subunit J)